MDVGLRVKGFEDNTGNKGWETKGCGIGDGWMNGWIDVKRGEGSFQWGVRCLGGKGSQLLGKYGGYQFGGERVMDWKWMD